MATLTAQGNEVLGFNPRQARGADGRWKDTPGQVLEGLEAHRLYNRNDAASNATTFDPNDESLFYMRFAGEDEPGHRETLLEEQSIQARYAYMTDKGHAKISDALRKGDISPPTGGATYGEAGYFNPAREDGVALDYFTQTHEVLGDASGAVHALDGGMSNNYFTEPVRLYRGVSVDNPDDFQPGLRWQDPSYTSTSFDHTAAVEFAKLRSGMPNAFQGNGETLRDADTSGEPMFFEIIVPPGTTFLPGAQTVSEVILERGATFEVLDRQGSTVTLRMERFDNTGVPTTEDA